MEKLAFEIFNSDHEEIAEKLTKNPHVLVLGEQGSGKRFIFQNEKQLLRKLKKVN